MSHLYQEVEEAYEVVKVAILVHNHRTFKITVMRDMQKSNEDVFIVRAYVEAAIQATPGFSDDHLCKEITVWSHFSSFPWVKHGTVEGAMSQAISVLKADFKS